MSDYWPMTRQGGHSTIAGLAVRLSVAAVTGATYGLRGLRPDLDRRCLPTACVAGVELLGSVAWARDERPGCGGVQLFHIEPTGAFNVEDGGNWIALGCFSSPRR